MTDKKTYPELVEAIKYLQKYGHAEQSKVCVKALYDLEKKDKRIDELEHQLRVECDTYLWNRKRMSRRIALLEYWMERLFKYVSSQEAKRNHLTMATEIPDYLMLEGEGILHHLAADWEASCRAWGEKE